MRNDFDKHLCHGCDQPSEKGLIEAAMRRRRELLRAWSNAFGLAVQGGPFRGMTLTRDVSWGDGDLLPKLIGIYEAELHQVLDEVIKHQYSKVINIGCAEGYYAVGFATRMRQCEIIAFDSMDLARDFCRSTANQNGVQDRVTILARCTLLALRRQLESSDSVFLFVDCEGDELTLLSPREIPQLCGADFLVECHDFVHKGLTQELYNRFASTHSILLIEEEVRPLRSSPALASMSALDRAIASCEFRPERMNWLYCRSKAGIQGAWMKRRGLDDRKDDVPAGSSAYVGCVARQLNTFWPDKRLQIVSNLCTV